MFQVTKIVFNAMRGWTRVSLVVVSSNNDRMIAWVRQNTTDFWFTSFQSATINDRNMIRRFFFQDAADALAFKLVWYNETAIS